MADERKYPRSGRRSILDYATFQAQSGEYELVCINRAVLDVARVFLEQRGRWPTTYALSYGPDSYTPIGPTELDVVDELISEFLEDTGDMNCDDLLQEISAIGDAITAIANSGGCGCGSSRGGETTPPLSTVDPGPPGEQQGPPPDGFSSWTEYEAYKCDIAEWILQQVEGDISWWLTADWVAMTLTAFGASLLTPIPGDELAVLLALIVALTLQGVAATALTTLQNAVSNSRDALLCAMYEADTASAAESSLDSAIDTAVDNETSAIWAGLLKSILGSMFNSSNLNRLFERDDGLADSGVLPTGDCSGCASCADRLTFGTSLGGNQYESADNAGVQLISLVINDEPNDCGPNENITINILSGSIGWNNMGYRFGDSDVGFSGCTGANLHCSDTPPSWPVANTKKLQLSSSGGTFSVEVVKS